MRTSVDDGPAPTKGPGRLRGIPWLRVAQAAVAFTLAAGAHFLDGEGVRMAHPVAAPLAYAVSIGLVLLSTRATGPESPASAELAAPDILEGRFGNVFGVSWYSFPAAYFLVPASPVALRARANTCTRPFLSRASTHRVRSLPVSTIRASPAAVGTRLLRRQAGGARGKRP